MQKRLERAVSRFLPGARVFDIRDLKGGMSGTLTSFHVQTPAGTDLHLCARQPPKYKFRTDPAAAESEFQLLEALFTAGLRVPKPLYLDEATDDEPQPFFIYEFVPGAPRLTSPDVHATVLTHCRQLAEIHRLDVSSLLLPKLPTQTPGFGNRHESPNQYLREDDIYDALERLGARTSSTRPCLRHGDYWPGNIVWQGDEIAAVIDWEEALIGEPLADLSIARLDILWVYGQEAMQQLTDQYERETGLDLEDLPYWDLCASTRPIANLEEWAPAYTDLGRPDITYETMARDHRWFVDQALKQAS